MNREIKFRAFIDGEMKPVSILHNLRQPGRSSGVDFTKPAIEVTLLPEDTPIMQYTGLKDKNGIEIYEGDILNVQFFAGESSIENYSAVTYQDGCFMDGEIGLWETYADSVVVGNIHQTPELL